MLASLIVILASSVSNQVSVYRTQASETNPQSGAFADYLAATLDLDDAWSLDLGLTVTAESPTPAAQQVNLGAQVISMLTGGIDWEVTDNWSFGLDLGFAPSTMQETGADITVGTVNAIAVIQSTTSELDAGLDVSYDTAGASDLEWYLTAGVAGMHLSTDQSISRIGKATLTQLRNACATQPTRRVCKAITPVAVELDSERLSLGATATAWRNNDFTLTGDFYHYEQDPKAVLYPSIAAAQLGMGAPIAPLEYLVRGEYARKFGDLQAKLWIAAGQYEPGTGDTTRAIGLKLQYKFTKAFKMWLQGSGQSDVAESDTAVARSTQTIRSTTVAMGAQLRF